MDDLAPVLLFTYNRPWHTRETIGHLVENRLSDKSILYVFSDGPKNNPETVKVREVREYLATIKGFKEIHIIKRESNFGLARSIKEGVSEIISKHGKIIVLEDDLVTSPYFLNYMNEALDMYEDELKVASIHGYCYPVKKRLPDTFFIKGADCWGWATWERAWRTYEQDEVKLLNQINAQGLEREFNFNNSISYTKMLKKQIRGKIDSWAITWYASAFLLDMFTLYPYPSLVRNIGHDYSGTHKEVSNIWGDRISKDPISLTKIPIEENAQARVAFEGFYRKLNNPIMKILRAKNKVLPILKGGYSHSRMRST